MAARLTAYVVAFIVGVTFIAGLIVGAQRDDDGPVDLIIVNGKVFTGEEARTPKPWPSRATRCCASDPTARSSGCARAQTTVVDARGGSVLPGLQRCAPAPAERRPRARSGEPERGVDARGRPADDPRPGPKPTRRTSGSAAADGLYAPFPERPADAAAARSARRRSARLSGVLRRAHGLGQHRGARGRGHLAADAESRQRRHREGRRAANRPAS